MRLSIVMCTTETVDTVPTCAYTIVGRKNQALASFVLKIVFQNDAADSRYAWTVPVVCRPASPLESLCRRALIKVVVVVLPRVLSTTLRNIPCVDTTEPFKRCLSRQSAGWRLLGATRLQAADMDLRK